MSTSVGEIGLDLVINNKKFDKQLSGIKGTAKKAAATIAAAFSIKKLVDFGKECIELGSDLQEVENVVNVTFPKMSKQIDNFAKNAASQFGLSETMAKKFTGTFGAMAKAFGFGERQAYDMSTALTGLAGDVASFYNLSQDEAYTKLKSVFTGETESLKDLGVVMTQTALDSYALANGFGKTTKQMSEMEKVALRYQFVQKQLSEAASDFNRTSNGWANQVRILKLQFDSLKATIGQGLINVLTPVIKVINTIIGKLMSLANAFKSFTELITGKKSGEGVSSTVSGMEGVTDAADAASNAVGGTGSAAKKAAKEIKNATTGIDELNIISPDTGSASGTGGSGYSSDNFDMGELDTSGLGETENKYQKLIDRFRELAGLAKKGFRDGFGDASVFDSIQKSVEDIKESLRDIFVSTEVLDAVNEFADSIAYNFGKVAGSLTSAGASIADGLFGGISIYLNENKPRIQEFLISMFDIGSRRAEIIGKFSETVAGIFEVFRSDVAKEIIADLIASFANGFMGLKELYATIKTDVLDLLLTPIVNNADAIKNVLNRLLELVKIIVGEIANFITFTVDEILRLYEEYIRPVIEDLKLILTELLGYVLGIMQGILDFLIGVFTGDWNKAWEGIKKILENVWNLMKAVVTTVINAIKGVISAVITEIQTTINTTLMNIKSVWESIWNSVKTSTISIFEGIWTSIKKTINSIISGVEKMANGVVRAINAMIEALNGLKFDIPSWIPGVGGKTFGFNIPGISEVSIPRLANGGFVRANTPRLAMIGDNKRYGEIVSPENKLQEMVDKAVALALASTKQDSNMSEQYLIRMIELLQRLAELLENLELSVNIGDREIARANERGKKEIGYEVIT